MFRKLLAVFLLCFASGNLLAASKPAPKPSGKPPLVEEDLLPRAVFSVLMGELALDRGKTELALSAYVDLARRTNDPRVLERAFEIAAHARQYEIALQLAQLWGTADPQSFKAQQAITATLVQLNRTEELTAQIALMLERDKPQLAENLLELNRMLARQPDRAAVERLIKKVTAPYADLPEAHYALGVAAYASGNLARARTETAKAIELRPDWELAALVHGKTLAKNSPEEAIQFLQNFVATYSKAADTRIYLARLLLAAKRYSEAREHFDRILEDYPDAPEALYPAAMLALQQNDTTHARHLLDKLMAGSFPDKSTVHFFLGQIDEDEKHYDAALDHFRQVIAGDQYLSARLRMAILLTQLGRVDEALTQLKATQAKTKEERLRLDTVHANILREAKRYDEALTLFEKLVAQHPDDVELLYDSALLAERLGKIALFETRLRHLLKLKPDDTHSLNALGYSLADRNVQLDEAYALIKKAADLKPNDPFIMDSLGWVLYRQGKLQEGLNWLEAAHKIRPDPEIAAHLGEVLWKVGRREEALQVWRDASAKHPGSDVLSATLKRFQP